MIVSESAAATALVSTWRYGEHEIRVELAIKEYHLMDDI